MNAPPSLGSRLGRLSLKHGFSVLRISKVTGATRQTVYNWMAGGSITPAYRKNVTELVAILKTAKSADDAWKASCRHFKVTN